MLALALLNKLLCFRGELGLSESRGTLFGGPSYKGIILLGGVYIGGPLSS